MFTRLKLTLLACLVTNTLYLLWLLSLRHNPLSFTFMVGEFAIVLLTYIFIFDNWKRVYMLQGGPYSLRPVVDIFITTKNEDIAILEKTIKSALKIYYPNKRVYILDDGARPEVKKLSEKLKALYLSRPNIKEKPFKAANLNYALIKSFGNFILTLDADMTVSPSILDDTLGFFAKPNVAFISTRQGFNVKDDDFNHEYIFYEFMQTGRNSEGVGMSCGSGVIYRRSALDEISGFQEWNLVEDLYTSYVLHSAGYSSVYSAQPYTIGDAPLDIATIYKQRGTWAQDTLRLFIWKNPLLNFRLSLKKRLHYAEIGYAYIVSGLVLPLIYTINIFSLFMNNPILTEGKEFYIFFKLPAFVTTILLFSILARTPNSYRMWAGLFPVYQESFFKALMYVKGIYKVTAKGVKQQVNVMLVFPQLFFIIIGLTSCFYHLMAYGVTWVLIVDTVWLMIMIYFLTPVIKIGLNMK